MFEDDSYWSGRDENVTTNVDDHTVTGYQNVDFSTIKSHINVHSLIKCYQQSGHLVADLDPLGITTISVKEEHGIKRRADESVTKNYFDFSASDMDKEFLLPPSTFIGGSRKKLKLRFIE